MLGKNHRYTAYLLCALLWAGADSGRAEVFTYDTQAEWSTWQFPAGVVQPSAEGQLRLREFRKRINAAEDAHLFSHPTQQRGEVSGGIWLAGSAAGAAGRIIDGDEKTFWQPDQDDQLVDWVVEIDLGRTVLAEELRLHFPDREGARPFGQFSVFVATGARIKVTDDVFKYNLVHRTTRPNEDHFIRIPISDSRDTTYILDPGMAVAAAEVNHHFAIQFIRVVVDEWQADAALAEVEVIATGDNVSLGTLERGGSFGNGLLAREPQNMFDGNMDTFGNVFTVKTKGGWQESGVWWEGDLGALFWIDELFLYYQTRGEALSFFLSDGFNYGQGYSVLFSDGQRTIAGGIDYAPLLEQPNGETSRERELRHFRYVFRPRKIRYLFFHALTDQGWYSHPMEMMLFSPGYPAQVTIRSDFINLGELVGDGRPKAIEGLSWEAETPPATRLQLRSRSGNALEEVHTFYDRKGEQVSHTQWESLPKVIRGPVDTTIVAGGDWGEWSNFYQFSGELFKSETPRRFIQLELIVSTEDPRVAPVVHSLSVEFENALVQQARGRLLPRRVEPNEEIRFTYTLWSNTDDLDTGFDRLRFRLPSAVDAADVAVRVGVAPVQPSDLHVDGDSLLFITLSEPVLTDSVQVAFTTRVLRNATSFPVDLGYSQQPGLWQSVEAADRRANIVFLPDLAVDNRLIGDLDIVPPVFTPNGDGVNENVEIRFVLFKATDVDPSVRIFDLAGRLVAELDRSPGGDIKIYTWSGRDAKGTLVRPGIYLCHIDVGAEAGDDVVVRTLPVVY
jgi:hypothetical protein